MNFHIDFEGKFTQDHVKKAVSEIRLSVVDVVELSSKSVPWFPTKMTDFNHIGKRILSEGDGIQASDHPGFRDELYKARRKMITNQALDYEIYQPIKNVDYTDEEKSVWKYCYPELKRMFKTNACQEFNWTIDQFEKEVGLCADSIL